jgi:hypothetical protein
MSMLGTSMDVGVSEMGLRSALKLIKPKASPYPLIRLGSAGDGGYLIPDDLEGVEACFSPGVANSADFELALADRGIRSFMADFSVSKSPISNPLFEFDKLYIATFNEPHKFTRLDDWIEDKNKLRGGGDLILQMDIEGNEWPILADVSSETLSRFRIIVMELHGLDNLLTNPLGIGIFESVFTKLNDLFSVVHLHANNCCQALEYRGVKIPRVLEVTLIRKDRYSVSGKLYEPMIPNSLDSPNVPNKPELQISRDWLS